VDQKDLATGPGVSGRGWRPGGGKPPRHTNTNPHSGSNAYPGSNANTHPNSNSNSNANTHPNSNSNADTYSRTNTCKRFCWFPLAGFSNVFRLAK
jgi:hypothetical protein